MKKLRLREVVSVTGPNLLGVSSTITFRPIHTKSSGWYWNPQGNSSPVPITARLAYHKPIGYLGLRVGGEKLCIWEHIGCLRFMGLDGVVVSSNKSLPPYHGSPHELWQALKPHVETTDEDVSWHTVSSPVEWHYSGSRTGMTQIKPFDFRGLVLKVGIDFAGVGKRERVYTFPNNALLEELFESRAQGWPPSNYLLSRTLALLGWPHHRHVTWPWAKKFRGAENRALLVETFLKHRVVDLLGALSLTSHNSLLSADVVSDRSGHEADLHVLKQIIGGEGLRHPPFLGREFTTWVQ